MPTRPMLRPPTIIAMLPVSNLMKSITLPVLISTTTVSLTVIRGSGYLMVRASWVTMYGTPLGPISTRRTRPSLYYENMRRDFLEKCSKYWERTLKTDLHSTVVMCNLYVVCNPNEFQVALCKCPYDLSTGEGHMVQNPPCWM